MNSLNGYLPELIAFHQVAKSGGFTKAAEQLNLSKAQLSKQVARLETLLNAQLFHRTTRRIALTVEGKHLLGFSENIIKLSQEAAESMNQFVNEEGGLIRMTAPSSLGDWFAPALLQKFQETLPGLKVEIDLSNAKRDLIEDNFDFALRAMDETNPDLIARYIGHIKDVVCASPTFIKKNKLKGNDPNELHHTQCIANSHQASWNHWKLQKGSRDLVVAVQGNYASSSYTTMKELALAGIGVARLPFYLVRGELEKGTLTHLYSEYTIATHPLYLVYPSRSYKMKKQKIVKDIIWEWMKGQKGVFQ